MTFQHFKLEIAGDGIALITWDSPGRSMNVIDLKVIEELSAIVEQVAADAAIKGAVITSGKDTFSAAPISRCSKASAGCSRIWARPRARRRPPPRCSRKAASSRSSIAGWRPRESLGRRGQRHRARRRLRAHAGLSPPGRGAESAHPARPAEVKIGLFPGAGGTTRVARMLAPADALQFLLKGDQLRIERAKALKLIDAIVPPADLIKTAKDWVKQNPKAKAPWIRTVSACPADRSIPRPA